MFGDNFILKYSSLKNVSANRESWSDGQKLEFKGF